MYCSYKIMIMMARCKLIVFKRFSPYTASMGILLFVRVTTLFAIVNSGRLTFTNRQYIFFLSFLCTYSFFQLACLDPPDTR